MIQTSPTRRSRQVVRIIGLVKLLAEGGRPSVYQLAARFKTRRETIYRDLRTLEEVGYPIVGDESGRLSRPRLAPDFQPTVPPATLNRKELAALVWAAKQAAAHQPFAPALSTALLKLQALVPGRTASIAIALDGAVSAWERGVKDYRGLEPTILQLV